jgi:short-subunit dehydrogenase
MSTNTEIAAKNKPVALITGASSGIGAELAEVFAREGWHVILVARSTAKMDELGASLAKKYGATWTTFGADLIDPKAPEALAAEVSKAGLVVDALVNNAGFGTHGAFAELDPARELAMIQVNVTALVALTRIFLPGMIARKKGRILNVASTAAFQPGPSMAVYCATKAFVLSFSDALGEELIGTGVTATCLCPGATTSGFQAAASMESSKLFKDRKLPSSADVAEYGFAATMRGQRVAIHGFMNGAMVQSIRFAPRWLVSKMAKTILSDGSA